MADTPRKRGRPKQGGTVTVIKGGKAVSLDVQRELKKAEAVQLRIDGHDYRAIALALDIDVATALAWVREAVVRALPDEAKRTIVALELGRLDQLTRAYLPHALMTTEIGVFTKDGDIATGPIPLDSAVKAAKLVLEIADRRRKWAGLEEIAGVPDPAEMNDSQVDAELRAIIELAANAANPKD